MSKILTFLDAGVLMAGARGIEPITSQANSIVDDPNREFIVSIFLELETRPKAVYINRQSEAAWYESYFLAAQHSLEVNEAFLKRSYKLACVYGLGGFDALHAATALALKADEFITTEKPTKPIYRVPGLNVIYF